MIAKLKNTSTPMIAMKTIFICSAAKFALVEPSCADVDCVCKVVPGSIISSICPTVELVVTKGRLVDVNELVTATLVDDTVLVEVDVSVLVEVEVEVAVLVELTLVVVEVLVVEVLEVEVIVVVVFVVVTVATGQTVSKTTGATSI